MASAAASFIITATGATSALAIAAIQIGTGLAFTALSQALFRQDAPETPGIRTESRTQGDTTPQTFIFGTYATAGHLVAPFMSHAKSSEGNTLAAGQVGHGRYRTHVYDLSDIPVDSLEAVIVNGHYIDASTGLGTAHADYGPVVSDGSDFAGKMWVKFYDGTQTVADPGLLRKYANHPERPWTSDMIGRGVPYVICTMDMGKKSPFQGDPTFKFVVNGEAYDFTSTSVTTTTNPVSGIRSVLRGYQTDMSLTYPINFGLGVDADDVPSVHWTGQATKASALIGGKPTYAAGYEVKIANPDVGGDEPLSVIDQLLNACDGQIADVGGRWYINVGEPELPVASITDDDILRNRGAEFAPLIPIKDTTSRVRASFISPADNWGSRDTPVVIDSDLETKIGEARESNINLRAVTDGDQAQRLTAAWLADAQRGRAHTFVLPRAYSYLRPLQTITWTSERWSYTTKLFQIESVTTDPQTLQIALTVRERDPDDYDEPTLSTITSPSQEVAAKTALEVEGFAVSAVAVTDESSNDRRPGIEATWTTTDLPNVDGIQFEVRVDATQVVIDRQTFEDPDEGSYLLTAGLLPNVAYEVRARWLTEDRADWTVWEDVTTDDVVLGDGDVSPLAFKAPLAYIDVEAITSSDASFQFKHPGGAIVYLIGAGGGGGAAYGSGDHLAASGGGAGGFASLFVPEVDTGATYNVTIGGGGVGGFISAVGTASGSAGGNSSFVGTGINLAANGGSGGTGYRTGGTDGTAVGGAGGTASGGDFNYTGGDGGDATVTGDGAGNGVATGGGCIDVGYVTGTSDALDKTDATTSASEVADPLIQELREMQDGAPPFMYYDDYNWAGSFGKRDGGTSLVGDDEPFCSGGGGAVVDSGVGYTVTGGAAGDAICFVFYLGDRAYV